jgi:transposase-like protein
MAADMSQLIIVLLVFSLMWLVFRWQRQPHAGPAQVTATVQRLLRPRTPHACPACRQQAGSLPLAAHADPPIQPWRERKSRRGAPKRIATEGFGCPNRHCVYYRVTDAQIHAVVGDGKHGKRERIQTFRCQACGMTFSARRHTPLYRLKIPAQRVGEVLTALAEGLDISAAVRVFGHCHPTITAWVTRAGEHSALLHDRWFQNLHLPHLQLDELRTRLRSRAQALWLWVALDPLTTVIPGLHLGARTQDAAHTVVHDLRQRLDPTCTPVFTSDGLNLYFYALTAHFGQWVDDGARRVRRWQVAVDLLYGQVKKMYRRRMGLLRSSERASAQCMAARRAFRNVGSAQVMGISSVRRGCGNYPPCPEAAPVVRGTYAPHLLQLY